MKRASTKKVKVHPACAKRRAYTSVAMIGLAISMGTSSILLTRQSARGALAGEPVATPTPLVAGASGGSIRATPSNPYVQNLQTEIQRLWEKYPRPQTGSQAIQKQPPTQINSPVSVIAIQSTTTAPMDADSSESLQPLRGRQVSPELPPLAAVDTYLPKPLAPFKNYIWPTKGVVTSPFGWRWGRMHKGIDIAAPIGTPVFAAAPGVVVKAGWNSGGYGNLVDIQHADGSLTRYAHNYKILVQVGQVVKQGQEISEMGSSGYSTGSHCHFEVHPRGQEAVNPIAYLPRVNSQLSSIH